VHLSQYFSVETNNREAFSLGSPVQSNFGQFRWSPSLVLCVSFEQTVTEHQSEADGLVNAVMSLCKSCSLLSVCCSTEREGGNVRESLWVTRPVGPFKWFCLCRHTHVVRGCVCGCVCVCVFNTMGQMGIDVVNQKELTCCPGFDELFSLFNPSPSIHHMLGNRNTKLWTLYCTEEAAGEREGDRKIEKHRSIEAKL